MIVLLLLFGLPLILNALALVLGFGFFLHAHFNRRDDRFPKLAVLFALVTAVGLVWWSVNHRLDLMTPLTVLGAVGTVAAAMRKPPRGAAALFGALVLLFAYSAFTVWRSLPPSPSQQEAIEGLARREETRMNEEAQAACTPLREEFLALPDVVLDCHNPITWGFTWELSSDAGTPAEGYEDVAARLDATGTPRPKSMAAQVRAGVSRRGASLGWGENVTGGDRDFGLIVVPLDGGLRVSASGTL